MKTIVSVAHCLCCLKSQRFCTGMSKCDLFLSSSPHEKQACKITLQQDISFKMVWNALVIHRYGER